MGIAVCTFIKHDLDTSNLEQLAQQLAQRLDAIVIYGYKDDWTENNREATFDYIIKGYAGTNENKVYRMHCNDYYKIKLNLTEVENNDHYELVPNRDVKNNIWYEIYDLVNDDNDGFEIYKECFSPFAFFGAKWGGFCHTFMDEEKRKSGWEDSLHYFRKQVLHEKQLLGAGETVFYMGDWFIEYENAFEIALTGSWNDLVSYINDIPDKNKVIDLGTWYKNVPDYKTETPVVIKDDFSYWPSSD